MNQSFLGQIVLTKFEAGGIYSVEVGILSVLWCSVFFFKSPFKMHLFDLYIYITCGGEEGRTDHIRREIQS